MDPMRSGDLATTTVAELCRRLGHHGATGTLLLTGPDGTGRILFRAGRVVRAHCPGVDDDVTGRLTAAGLLAPDPAPLRDRHDADEDRLLAALVERGLVARDAVRLFQRERAREALAGLLGWERGSHRFEPDTDRPGATVDGGAGPGPDPSGLGVPRLLLDVARRGLGSSAPPTGTPAADAVVRPTTGGATPGRVTLEPDEMTVLAHVDGHRSVGRLADDLGRDRETTARIVAGLGLLGLVTVARAGEHPEPGDPVEPPPPPTAGGHGGHRPGAPGGTTSGDGRRPPGRDDVTTPEPGFWSPDDSGADEPEVWEADTGAGADDPEEHPGGTGGRHATDRHDTGQHDTGQHDTDGASDPVDASLPPDPSDESGGRTPRRGPRSSDEVSAFLRELSRLSLDETGPSRRSPGRGDAEHRDGARPTGDPPDERAERARDEDGVGPNGRSTDPQGAEGQDDDRDDDHDGDDREQRGGLFGWTR